MTQYCEGVATGSQTCPGTAPHVGYPTGGTLAGVWANTGSAAPAQANGHGIGIVAVAAATHFGNTTAASNRNAQYVVVSPTGTKPDGFNTPTGITLVRALAYDPATAHFYSANFNSTIVVFDTSGTPVGTPIPANGLALDGHGQRTARCARRTPFTARWRMFIARR